MNERCRRDSAGAAGVGQRIDRCLDSRRIVGGQRVGDRRSKRAGRGRCLAAGSYTLQPFSAKPLSAGPARRCRSRPLPAIQAAIDSLAKQRGNRADPGRHLHHRHAQVHTPTLWGQPSFQTNQPLWLRSNVRSRAAGVHATTLRVSASAADLGRPDEPRVRRARPPVGGALLTTTATRSGTTASPGARAEIQNLGNARRTWT